MDGHVIILEVPAHLRADKVNYSPIDETEDAQVLFWPSISVIFEIWCLSVFMTRELII